MFAIVKVQGVRRNDRRERSLIEWKRWERNRLRYNCCGVHERSYDLAGVWGMEHSRYRTLHSRATGIRQYTA